MRLLLFGFLAVSAAAAAQAASVQDGVFSTAQATRGEGVILDACARCHHASLIGGENDTPPLVGEAFWQKWKGATLGEFFEKMQATMPSDGPGKLTKAQYLAALAYILQANNLPAGKPLPSDVDALKQIRMEP